MKIIKFQCIAFRILRTLLTKESDGYWLQIIPLKHRRSTFKEGPNNFICIDHWPDGFETIVRNGKIRPKNPLYSLPSVFTCVASSEIPTPPPEQRNTTKALPSRRNVIPDQLAEFLAKDRITSFDDLRNKICENKIELSVPVINFSVGGRSVYFSK